MGRLDRLARGPFHDFGSRACSHERNARASRAPPPRPPNFGHPPRRHGGSAQSRKSAAPSPLPPPLVVERDDSSLHGDARTRTEVPNPPRRKKPPLRPGGPGGPRGPRGARRRPRRARGHGRRGRHRRRGRQPGGDERAGVRGHRRGRRRRERGRGRVVDAASPRRLNVSPGTTAASRSPSSPSPASRSPKPAKPAIGGRLRTARSAPPRARARARTSRERVHRRQRKGRKGMTLDGRAGRAARSIYLPARKGPPPMREGAGATRRRSSSARRGSPRGAQRRGRRRPSATLLGDGRREGRGGYGGYARTAASVILSRADEAVFFDRALSPRRSSSPRSLRSSAATGNGAHRHPPRTTRGQNSAAARNMTRKLAGEARRTPPSRRLRGRSARSVERRERPAARARARRRRAPASPSPGTTPRGVQRRGAPVEDEFLNGLGVAENGFVERAIVVPGTGHVRNGGGGTLGDGAPRPGLARGRRGRGGARGAASGRAAAIREFPNPRVLGPPRDRSRRRRFGSPIRRERHRPSDRGGRAPPRARAPLGRQRGGRRTSPAPWRAWERTAPAAWRERAERGAAETRRVVQGARSASQHASAARGH